MENVIIPESGDSPASLAIAELMASGKQWRRIALSPTSSRYEVLE